MPLWSWLSWFLGCPAWDIAFKVIWFSLKSNRSLIFTNRIKQYYLITILPSIYLPHKATCKYNNESISPQIILYYFPRQVLGTTREEEMWWNLIITQVEGRADWGDETSFPLSLLRACSFPKARHRCGPSHRELFWCLHEVQIYPFSNLVPFCLYLYYCPKIMLSRGIISCLRSPPK